MRQYRWQSLDEPGFELLEIEEVETGIHARGMVIGDWGEIASGATYHVTLAPDWSFRGINLMRLDGTRLRLRADGAGNWTDGTGAPLPELKGCIDIDLSGSPFTNTLPIRRARFEPGVPQRFTMAFIALDSFAVSPREQFYTQRDDTHFHYRSGASGFEADLETDAGGFVVTYPGLFQRVEN